MNFLVDRRVQEAHRLLCESVARAVRYLQGAKEVALVEAIARDDKLVQYSEKKNSSVM